MSPLILPAAPALLSRKAWTAFLVCLLLVGVLAPVLNLVVPAGSALQRSLADQVLAPSTASVMPKVVTAKNTRPAPETASQ